MLDNLRQGRFQTLQVLESQPETQALASSDVNGDGFPRPNRWGAGFWLSTTRPPSGFESDSTVIAPSSLSVNQIVPLDADNDGRLDLATVGSRGAHLHHQIANQQFETNTLDEDQGSGLVARDLDSDGDLDLAVSGVGGVRQLENIGGNKNGWLALQLTGLTKGNSKNNVFGLGSIVEIRHQGAYQFREVQDPVTHIGLGSVDKADLRVVWTNGVPQNRIRLEGKQNVVEEQLLKGSCPFLYTWNGAEYAFVTDLLWGAPIGLPVAENLYAGADPGELVEVTGAKPRNGNYELQITEELWEAAYFDQVRLWVVDAPEDVEVDSNLRIVPGKVFPEEILASREVRPVTAAWDGQGRDVTLRVQDRDHVYADGYLRSRYQGHASEPWSMTFDLGQAPDGPVRLLLDGWIFPSDASLNLAMSQTAAAPPLHPRLEVETSSGWQVLMPSMGFPAGKTKTMVIDTPPLPPGSQRLRIITSLWLGWDRIAWTDRPEDGAAVVRAKLDPDHAELHYRGFSKLTRLAPNGPHHYDYQQLLDEDPWLPFPGSYTRYGEVSELLLTADDRSVILGAGDEMTVRFSARDLPELRAGWTRTLFLESQGWDKDADKNTGEGLRLEPLPFRAMTHYPFATGEHFPRSETLDSYRREWLTRRVD